MRKSATAYYPMFVSLNQRVCLVVGGGKVGERKIRSLLHYGASVRLVAVDLTPWLSTQHELGNLSWIAKEYDEVFLQDVDLVFAATSNADLNRRIADGASKRKLWCNMAMEPERGSFIVPSAVERGDLTIAISTAGQSPAVAKRIREALEEQFGQEWIVYLEFMGMLRNAIQSLKLATQENQSIFRKVATLPLPNWIGRGERQKAIEAVYEICRPWLSFDELNQLWDKTWKNFSSSSPHCATAVQQSDT